MIASKTGPDAAADETGAATAAAADGRRGRGGPERDGDATRLGRRKGRRRCLAGTAPGCRQRRGGARARRTTPARRNPPACCVRLGEGGRAARRSEGHRAGQDGRHGRDEQSGQAESGQPDGERTRDVPARPKGGDEAAPSAGPEAGGLVCGQPVVASAGRGWKCAGRRADGDRCRRGERRTGRILRRGLRLGRDRSGRSSGRRARRRAGCRGWRGHGCRSCRRSDGTSRRPVPAAQRRLPRSDGNRACVAGSGA